MGGQNVIIRGDQNGQVASVSESGGLANIPVQELRIDQARFWDAQLVDLAVVQAASIEMLIVVPAAVIPQISFGIAVGGDALAELFEGTTVSANGTALPTLNLNRRQPDAPALTLFSGPTITTDGTKLVEVFFPGGEKGSTPGGAGNIQTKFILAESTLYLARLTNNATQAQPLSIEALWSEEPAP